MKNKVLVALISAALLLSMVGCSGDQAVSSDPSATSSINTGDASSDDASSEDVSSEDSEGEDGEDEDGDEDYSDEDGDDEGDEDYSDEDGDDEGDEDYEEEAPSSKGPFKYNIKDVKPANTFSGCPWSSVIAQPPGRPASVIPGKGEHKIVALGSYMNADIFASPSAPRDGNFDDGKPNPLIFSSVGVKQNFTFDGIPYKYDDNVYQDGKNNAIRCLGQTIQVTDASRKQYQCDYIGMIAYAYNGDAVRDITVVFDDGTFEITPVSIYDWANGNMAETRVLDAVVPHAYRGGIGTVANVTPRYGEVDVVKGKTVKEIKLPHMGYMYVMSLTLVNAR